MIGGDPQPVFDERLLNAPTSPCRFDHGAKERRDPTVSCRQGRVVVIGAGLEGGAADELPGRRRLYCDAAGVTNDPQAEFDLFVAHLSGGGEVAGRDLRPPATGGFVGWIDDRELDARGRGRRAIRGTSLEIADEEVEESPWHESSPRKGRQQRRSNLRGQFDAGFDAARSVELDQPVDRRGIVAVRVGGRVEPAADRGVDPGARRAAGEDSSEPRLGDLGDLADRAAQPVLLEANDGVERRRSPARVRVGIVFCSRGFRHRRIVRGARVGYVSRMPATTEIPRTDVSPSKPVVDARPAFREVEAIATNFKRRLSGVTSTLERVVPVQARDVRIAALGPGLSAALPKVRFRDLLGGWRRPATRPFRIWHARRNVEMLPAWLLRDLLRMRLKVVFTSASQRHHTAWSRFLISRMDAVIATSAKTAAYLRRESTVVRHGIDVEVFHPAQDKARAKRELGLPAALLDRRLVGCFGRVRRQKGTDVFVDAMLELLPSRPEVAAIVLGRATEAHRGFQQDLKRRVAAAGLADRIFFAGEVAPKETPAWYRVLDLFIAPQRWEGFGVTPLEAMASAVPVVATTVGAFEELVVDGETGSLVPPGEVTPMAEAAARWLDDPEALAKASLAARAHVAEAFSLESEAAGINAVYERLWREAR